MKTQWTITQDLIADPSAKPGTNCNAAGMVGPRDATLTADEIISHPKAAPFTMYDDDGELYYRGMIVGPDDYAPLDDFGMPNAGCTEIRIARKGR